MLSINIIKLEIYNEYRIETNETFTIEHKHQDWFHLRQLSGLAVTETKTECIDTRHIKNILNLLQSFLANTLTVSHASLVNSEKSTGNTS